jgi:hypothetical protein
VLLGAELAGDLLLCFRGSEVAFGLVGGARDAQVGGEAQQFVLAVAEALQQLAEGCLLAAGSLLHLAEDDAMPEGFDQGRGDVGWHGGQALGPRSVRGVVSRGWPAMLRRSNAGGPGTARPPGGHAVAGNRNQPGLARIWL